MRFTRPNKWLSGALLASCGVLSCAVMNCGSNGDHARFEGFERVDAAPPPARGTSDASTQEAAPRDAEPFDATTPPIACESDSCATSLTTLWSNDYGDTESFCALLRDGTVACWGANGAGQLGRGEEAGTVDSAIPMRVVGLSNIVSLERTCAIDKDGAAYCWWTGPFLKNDVPVPTREPTPVKLPIGPVKKLSVSSTTGCAVVEEGVVCWGRNDNGQVAPIGINGPSEDSFPPRTVALPSGGKVRDIVVGDASFALMEDGSIVSWGATPPLGRVTSLSPDSDPQPIGIPGMVSALDVQQQDACAAVSGIVYCWGPGGYDPIRIDLSRALPSPVVTPEPIRQVSTTSQRLDTNSNPPLTLPHRWCAVGASGAVYCAGSNTSGQAGDGTKNYAYDAVKVAGLPAPAVEVRASFDSTCALLTSGKVYCWGGNFYGQLGRGQLKESSLIPQEVLLP